MKKIGITAMLIFVNIVAIIFLINFRNDDESEMIVSNTKNHSNDVSIMIQTSAGSTTYTKSTSETWPDSTKYHLNPSKSYCKNGSTYNLSGSKVLVNLKRADDCYFYFDLGANITFSMQLFQNENYNVPKPDLYTNGNYMAVFDLPTNKNISSVCVVNEQSLNNCTWKPISELTSIDSTGNKLAFYNPISLSSGEGLKTLYAYVKDSSNNIYGYQSDTIKLDNTPPTCSINVNSSGITSSVNDNYYTVSVFQKDGTNISGNNTSLAIGKYNLKVWDGAGNKCEDSIEIASDSYTVKTKTCMFFTGSYSAGTCPYGFVYYNQNYCIATYGSCGENDYCSIGSCYPNYQGIERNNVCASFAPVGQFCGSDADTLSNGTCYYYYYHFEETSTTSSTCSVGTSFTCNSSNTNKSYVSSCELNAGCFAGFTKIEGTNYCYKK